MEIVKQVFGKLLKATNIKEVAEIYKEIELDKYRVSDDAYPKIKFRIKKTDIEELKKEGLITSENLLSKNFEKDPLSNLLYAVLWKNGDLLKIKHIIEGILEEKTGNKDNGLVFYQFGRYLTKEDGEPIIDQHVLRAFGIYKANGNEDEIKSLEKLSLITKKQKGLIKDYKYWLKTGLQPELMADNNYLYEVDKLLFALGKSLKVK